MNPGSTEYVNRTRRATNPGGNVKGQKPTCKTFHTGKRIIKPFVDSKSRSKSYCKRRDTLFQKAKDIFQSTGTEVSLQTKSLSGESRHFQTGYFQKLQNEDKGTATATSAVEQTCTTSATTVTIGTQTGIKDEQHPKTHCQVCGINDDKPGKWCWLGCEAPNYCYSSVHTSSNLSKFLHTLNHLCSVGTPGGIHILHLRFRASTTKSPASPLLSFPDTENDSVDSRNSLTSDGA
ncbi:uncharacterized protein LOC117335494 isoform X2 [Pecten maximus]|uniref:uncharacterized protein LOC117335494 isoform X2 n=1 Tax=Pecten maximus TaxID=6579 RepID=UPI0014589CB8|nr:uncharacterized protein LOC117335494 isoform X2 [Pecten maximus]